ncbi:MAG: hypothetical protein ACLP5E_15540 [Streptosporangiaceae bacterium]
MRDRASAASCAACSRICGALLIIVPVVPAGAGTGSFVQVALLAWQNAVEHRYGVARA